MFEYFKALWKGHAPSFAISAEIKDVPRPVVFDPALRNFSQGVRHGEPAFTDPARAAVWKRRRRATVDHVLEVVSGSPWRECLVLRGSVLLQNWFADRARPPGDIDWVVWPDEYSLRDPRTNRLFDDLQKRLQASPTVADVTLRADRAVTEDIWTYERAPGRRLVFPWQADGADQGVIQMDFVFGEPLPNAPETIEYRLFDGRTTKLTAASREASLIWKLVWLETDSYAQGKDLFDAVLLAEHVTPQLDRLLKVLEHAEGRTDGRPSQLKPDFPMKWKVDWDNFKLEYPDVLGTVKQLQRRLTDLLLPMFEM